MFTATMPPAVERLAESYLLQSFSFLLQTVMFTATMPPAVERLAKSYVVQSCILLHLGLVSSNRIAWNASRDCPLSEHSIPPETLRGQWPPLRAIATRPRAFNEPVCSLFIIFSYYSDDLSNFIYIFNYLNKLFADYRHPFVHVYTA